MNLKYITDNNYIVTIKKEYLSFDENIKKLTEKIFDKLKAKYNINNIGYYNVDLYKDDNYGMILEILDIEPDIFAYKLNVDLNIVDTTFFIKTDEICKGYYTYKNNIYKKIETIKDYDDGTIEYKYTDSFKLIDI